MDSANRIAVTYYPDPEPLWQDGVPGWQDESAPAEWAHPGPDRGARGPNGNRERVRIPTVQAYPAPAESATGAAVVIFPGGGFVHLAIDKEGYDIAAWLNTLGVTAVVVRYRTGTDLLRAKAMSVAEMDARRAVQWTRANAGRLGINPSLIGVMGFSAGGHLAASASTAWTEGDPNAVGPVGCASSRPDFSVLAYAALNDGHLAAIGKSTPPAFVLQTCDDLFPPDRAIAYSQALHNAGVPTELHLFTEGLHGYGLGVWGGPVAAWPALLANWLERLPAAIADASVRARGGFTSKSPLNEILADEKAKAVLLRVVSLPEGGSRQSPSTHMSLAHLATMMPDAYPPELLAKLDIELAKLV